MFSISRAFFFILLLLVSVATYAEGPCPPGQYPVGGQGVLGCAPIPSGASGAVGPRATGRWIKTWGVISVSRSGDMGASVGQRSKRTAISEAQQRCATYGAKDCSVFASYKNQCIAYGIAQGGRKIRSNTAATKEVAVQRVQEMCAKDGLVECEIKYTDCSEPIFEKF
ncbi:DUF4189 domain-containing protein [Stenotrophomonas pictorum]|jgi:hypothetical protein|uniref:DUF4189 domain-containing protein n=1 Tax=Stenotrophomonas pictorum TaxID=86184 RepID=UPI000B78B29F|nr:DUF4189 domain-containing protein [Stenotrophomonas pictorum]